MMSSGDICWSSKKQPIVALSTKEAEFVAAAACSCQAIWLRKMLKILNQKQPSTTVIYCDNMSTIKLSKNSVLHGRSKHIDVRFQFSRDLCKEGTIKLNFCRSDEQIADLFTKALNNHCSRNLEERWGCAESKM